jgi:hypothetical protein
MYLSATTHTLEIVSDATATTTEPQYVISYNDHTSTGMTLPQSSVQGNLTGSTTVTALSAPAASTTRQISHMTIYNADSVTRIITVKKDVSGTEYVLVRASLATKATLEYSRENGFTIISQSSQESYIVTEFIANGTWTKPANLKSAFVCCVGAGGGGGSGRRDAAGTNRFGGGGGGGGAISWQLFAGSALTSSYAITIGAGGTGGTGQTVDATNGNSGTAGGDTSFGTVVVAKGGSGASGGTSASGNSGSGGVANTSIIAFGPFSLNGASGGAGTTNSTSSPTIGFNGAAACPGGSGGSGINTANTAVSTSITGSPIYNNGTLIAGVATGVNGLNNQAKSLFFNTSIVGTYGIGTGGSGGNSVTLTGSNGGSYGTGGGGGAGVLNGTTSGAGGNGAGGLCVVLEIY